MSIWSAEIKELEKLYESFRGQLPDLEKELGQLIHSDDPNVILLYSRRCLEIIITDLCECELNRERGSEPLKGIIDKLNKEKKIPAHIASSMYGLNDLSTYGTHPKDFDPEQVKPVLVNLDIIIKWYLKYKDIPIKTKPEEEIQVTEEPSEDVKKEDRIEQQEKSDRLTKHKLLYGVLIIAILIIAGIIAFPKIFKRDTLEKLRTSGERISVAVMPFQNMTNDTKWDVWQDGIQEILTNSLSNSNELTVKQTESINNLIQSKGFTNNASITPSFASKVSQRMKTNVFIYGNIIKAGSIIRINAQLVDSKTKDVLKPFQIEGLSSEENIIRIIDSLSAKIKNTLIISNLGKAVSYDYKNYAYTDSPEAFKNFIYGKTAFLKRDFPAAVSLLSQAVAIDSNFIGALDMLAWSLWNRDMYNQAKGIALKLYEKRDQVSIYMKAVLNHTYTYFFGTINEDIKCLKQILAIDDQLPVFYFVLGQDYNYIKQFDKAIPELEKSIEIYKEWDSKPGWVLNYTELGFAYHKTGQYNKEKKLYKKAEQDFPDDPSIIQRKIILSFTKGDTVAVTNYTEKYLSILKENLSSEADIKNNLAQIYSEVGTLGKAEEYYRQTLLLEPDNPNQLNNLAFFLIDKDRNINEGIELVDKALAYSPDNFNFLHTKGWGLYKQGKYKEALDTLQRSWYLRRENAIYNHEAFLHLEAAKKAVDKMKNN
ncbi:MAG: tetratricopeptide repeat protein [Bacteroidales bacterium]|nr:tetratricopeptide repeat protein [Bacteroidales bacterium]